MQDDGVQGAGKGWQHELDELTLRQSQAQAMGGADKVRRQHDGGRLTIRERIDRLVDPGSLREIGSVAGMATYDAQQNLQSLTPSNRISGRATIDGRPVIVSGDDFTVRGGSADATIPEKTVIAERMANELRLPIIRIVEGSGGGGSVKTIETTGRANLPGGLGGSCMRYKYMTDNLGTGAGGGPWPRLRCRARCRAGRRQPLFHHDEIDLGHVRRRAACGGQDRRQAEPGQGQARRLGDPVRGRRHRRCRGHRGRSVRTGAALPVLPAVVRATACRRAGRATIRADRREERLFTIVPRDRNQPYKMRPLIQAVVDRDSFFEMTPHFGRPVITGLARLDGLPVAIMAGDPFHYGRRLDGGRLPEGRALCRSGRDVPPAGGASRRLPGLHDRA